MTQPLRTPLPDAPSRGSFTLIELLVVLAILVVVVSALGACMAAGLRVWESSGLLSEGRIDVEVAISLLAKDLRNAPVFFAVPFSGDSSGLSFAGLVPSHSGSGDDVVRVGTVRYSFVSGQGALIREEGAYGDAREGLRSERLASNLGSVGFQYLQSASSSSTPWSESWHDATNLPAAVRISLQLSDSRRDQAVICRTVILPRGCQRGAGE